MRKPIGKQFAKPEENEVIASFGPAPLPSQEKPDRFAELLKKIEEMIEDAIMAAREDESPSETYELVQQYMSSPTFNEYIRKIYQSFVVIPTKIFEVQSAATGDGVYTCYEQTLDATEWVDTAGDPKFDDKNATGIEVLNLAEFDPESTYVAHLAAGDLISAWRMIDDEANFRWVGVPFRQANADRPRIAYCKDAAGAATTIDCYLDTDATGTEITVTCSIAGGGNLNTAVPRLTDGLPIIVTKIGATWRCTTTFNASQDCP